ncbi:MAG: hypothetical protein KC729_04420 [Candidatus Eisenbacteria bacterium]|uniref:Carboxypeptidase regulatory-like domain-containing protein n=1 Tax=Eiseniibacteriota bacterium TaxID=2212470 RepID=A0A956LWP1_UNCEI|nr:hypothetical protein [Candidatus Eisenbacteria bacterium]
MLEPGGSGGSFPCRSVLLVALVALLALSLGAPVQAQNAGTGTILGQLFTAEHPDSVAGQAELTLIFRPAGAETVERVSQTAGPDGSYRFDGVSTDPTISYVIKVHYFGRDFLGAPIAFEAGQSVLEFNFLVARDAKPIPQSDGHPPMDGGMGGSGMGGVLQPVRQDPLAAVAIVAGLLAFFLLPVAMERRKGPAERPRLDGAASDLMRDIASLDLRFANGELAESDYRSVRSSLFQKLEEKTGAVETRATGR